jgi:pimeloyl-ACP methyl ester carboxylesterase
MIRHVLLPWLTFLIVLVAAGVLLSAILIVLMALTLLRPQRMTDAKATLVLQRLSPGDLRLRFENLRFHVRDERTGNPLALAAWWIPADSPSTRTVLLIHGYADAKVGSIAWAPTLHALGWNVVALDLRAHGESPCVFSTAGFWERHDVTQVINQLRPQRPRETQTFVLYGISLGAAVAIATAALRERERDARDDDGRTTDIDGVIMESPFGDYRRAVAAHGRMRGMPGGTMRDAAVRLAEWFASADFRAVRPMDLIGRVSCPVMVIHAGDDPFIPDDDAIAMGQALQRRGDARDVHWSIPDAGHVLGLAAVGADEYRERVGRFLDAVAEDSARESQLASDPQHSPAHGPG